MGYLPALRVSNEELAALSLCVYEEEPPGTAAAFAVQPGQVHVVKGWLRVRREELEARDMRVDVYQSFRHRASVLAVRGTVVSAENFKADFDVALGSINTHLVELIRHLHGVVQSVAARSRRNHIYLTGHSLGAYVACLAYLNMTSEAELRRRIRRVVLFESPGVPELSPGLDLSFSEREPWWEDVRSRIIEFLGAPNMINMRHRHIAGKLFRVKKYHCLVVDQNHVIKCVLGTASLALHIATLGLWIWAKIASFIHWKGIASDAEEWLGQLSRYEDLTGAEQEAWSDRRYFNWLFHRVRLKVWLKANGRTFIHRARSCFEMVDAYYSADKGLKATKTLCSVSGLARFSLGLSDEAAWTMQQHGMIGLWRSFNPGADLPRPDSYQIVKRWPRGVKSAALNLLKTCLRGIVPFHPASPGMHNVWRPNRMAEERVCRMAGYVFEEPRVPRWQPPLKELLLRLRRLGTGCRRQLSRAGAWARLAGERSWGGVRDSAERALRFGNRRLLRAPHRAVGALGRRTRNITRRIASRRRAARSFRVGVQAREPQLV